MDSGGVKHSPYFTSVINHQGFNKTTRYIRQTAQRLKDDFESDVPKTVDELCSLPGVGPKMAFLCLQVAWNMCGLRGP